MSRRIRRSQESVPEAKAPLGPFIEVHAEGTLCEVSGGSEIAYVALRATAEKVNCSAGPSFRFGVGETHTFDADGCNPNSCGAIQDDGSVKCPLVDRTVTMSKEVARLTIAVDDGDPITKPVRLEASAKVLSYTDPTAQ